MSDDVKLCPCCNRPLPDGRVGIKQLPQIARVELEAASSLIVRLLAGRYPGAATMDEILREIYAGTRDGGPLQARNGVSARVTRANKPLRRLGWKIHQPRRGKRNPDYFLRAVDPGTGELLP